MELIDIVKSADNINGSYLDLGYGTGSDCKKIFNLMLDKSIRKRDFILVDLFLGKNQGIWQNAHDQCNEVKNRLKKSASYHKVDITSSDLNFLPKIALVTIDLGINNIAGLKSVLHYLNSGALVIFLHKLGPEEVLSINDLSKQSRIHLKVLEHNNFSYLYRGPISNPINNTNPTRTRSVLT